MHVRSQPLMPLIWHTLSGYQILAAESPYQKIHRTLRATCCRPAPMLYLLTDGHPITAL